MLAYLAREAGKDPHEDRYKTGYIAAIDDLLQADVEQVELKETFE